MEIDFKTLHDGLTEIIDFLWSLSKRTGKFYGHDYGKG